ncbi:antimicrobial peptide NK-lysin [Nelusetta ayraudi]|uniref:antimicrobial peptide NK-lysin n=1 Tax=Nelusetta ayraudi TaxID=303726 RepID=UPI003F70F338
MKSSTLLLCALVALCVAGKLQAKSVNVSTDDDDDDDEEDLDLTGEPAGLPGLCWLCKWGLNKVKKQLGKNETAAIITDKLNKMCSHAGLLKSRCQKFVKSHISVLVEELTTSDNVRTICVNLKACKKKEDFAKRMHDLEMEMEMELEEYI